MALLFARFASAVVDVAVAVFESVVPAPAVTLTTIVTVAEPSGPREPMLAVTVPFVPTVGPLQVPRLGVQVEKVVPTGRGSVMTTFAARAGPLFVTTTV